MVIELKSWKSYYSEINVLQILYLICLDIQNKLLNNGHITVQTIKPLLNYMSRKLDKLAEEVFRDKYSYNKTENLEQSVSRY